MASGYAARTEHGRRQQALVISRDDKECMDLQSPRVASNRLTDIADVDIRPLGTLYAVLSSLREQYVEQLTVEDEGKMTHDAMRAMLASFSDPNTRFIEQEQREVIVDAEQGKFHGIGAVLAIKQTWRNDKKNSKEPVSEEHLVVVTILPGSPAANSGLKTGDEILAINGKDILPFNPYLHLSDIASTNKFRDTSDNTKRKIIETEQKRIDDGMSIIDAEKMLTTGGDKKPITLTIAAKSPANPTKITVEPSEFVVDPVEDARVEADGVGYIRINYFNAATAGQFVEAIRSLREKSVNSLVLDMRGATGSNMAAVEKIASFFAPDRTIAVLIKSRARKSPIHVPSANGDAWRKPVVLLVDRGTARAPEVLAASLKEIGAVRLVGEKTYGNFTDSTLIDLSDGSAIMMATGKYVTAKGFDYNGKGLPVDVPAATKDQQFTAAIKLLANAGGK